MTRIAGLLCAATLVVGCSRPGSKVDGASGGGDSADDRREAALAGSVVELLASEHLRDQPLDDGLSRKAFAEYLDRLDPGKAFLLRGDADRLRKHDDRIDDELKAGRLGLAHEGATLFTTRVGVVAALVAELLAAPLDHEDDESIELDPEKLELAATEDELRERWRQRLELEVLERVALMEEQLTARLKRATEGADAETDAGVPLAKQVEIPATREAREAKARTDLAERYAGRFARMAQPNKLAPAADLINAVSAVFDPHTTYMPPADKANFDIAMSGSLEGIGAVLSEHDHYVEVVELVPGGASARQGVLKPGDLIMAVAQEGAEAIDIADMPLEQVVSMVRGKKNTVVSLTIRNASAEVSVLTITRDVVIVEDAYARGAVIERKDDAAKYGYVHLPSFYGGFGSKRSSADDVRELLREAAARKVSGVILDLRSNGGGLLDDAIELTGLLVDDGPVVQTRRRGGRPKVLGDTDEGVTYQGPVLVLVDRFTASASEIVAAALQDYQRAVIVGTAPTHGKGSVQVVADLDQKGIEPLGDFKLTIQQYFRIDGGSVQWRGVVPDVLLPDPAGHLETGERHLHNSIPWSEIDAVDHRDWTPAWKLPALVASSQGRVAGDDVLSRIAAATDLMKKRSDDTRVPLQRTAWETLRASRRTELEAVMPDLDKASARLTITSLALKADEKSDPAQDERVKRWRTQLARDPWLAEAAAILADMVKTAN